MKYHYLHWHNRHVIVHTKMFFWTTGVHQASISEEIAVWCDIHQDTEDGVCEMEDKEKETQQDNELNKTKTGKQQKGTFSVKHHGIHKPKAELHNFQYPMCTHLQGKLMPITGGDINP